MNDALPILVPPLLAEVSEAQAELAALAGSIASALAVGATAWILARIIFSPRQTSSVGSYEAERRVKIRSASLTYNLFEPLIDDLKKFTTPSRPQAGENYLRVAQAAELAPPWSFGEQCAVRYVEGGLLGIGAALILLPLAGLLPAVFALVIITAGYGMFAAARLKETAETRKQAVLRRMPYAVDLMALVMEAGGTFDDALQSLLTESAEHPIGKEFSTISRSIQLGRSRREAFTEFQTRLDQDDIREFVTAVINGEEFGSPLSQILRAQADQMRLKRSQWAEKAAGSAEVQMVFPGMLIMVACLIVVAAPIVLRLLEFI